MDVWLIFGQLEGYVAMEAGVCGLVLGDGVVVEVDRAEASNLFVAHALAHLDILGCFKGDEGEGCAGRLEAFELEGCTRSAGATRADAGAGELTKLGEALELVQAALEEAGRKALCRRTHGEGWWRAQESSASR
jgi:hypothetical protein